MILRTKKQKEKSKKMGCNLSSINNHVNGLFMMNYEYNYYSKLSYQSYINTDFIGTYPQGILHVIDKFIKDLIYIKELFEKIKNKLDKEKCEELHKKILNIESRILEAKINKEEKFKQHKELKSIVEQNEWKKEPISSEITLQILKNYKESKNYCYNININIRSAIKNIIKELNFYSCEKV